MKTLVAFFSATGVTKGLAKKLAKAADADIFEIKPKLPYTSADLDWTNKKSRSSVEMNDRMSRPEIAEMCGNLGDYDTVYIGFPIWWYVAPTIINTFLESYDFAGKKIVLFATSGSSGMGKALDVLKPLCPENVKWVEGKVLSAYATEDELKTFIESAEKA